MPLSLTILTTAFPPEKRGTIVGNLGRHRRARCADGTSPDPMQSGGLMTHAHHWISERPRLIASPPDAAPECPTESRASPAEKAVVRMLGFKA